MQMILNTAQIGLESWTSHCLIVIVLFILDQLFLYSFHILQLRMLGTVAAVIKFKGEAEVVEMANDTNYRLTAHITSTH